MCGSTVNCLKIAIVTQGGERPNFFSLFPPHKESSPFLFSSSKDYLDKLENVSENIWDINKSFVKNKTNAFLEGGRRMGWRDRVGVRIMS